MYSLFANSKQYYGITDMLCRLGLRHNPCCVVRTASVYTDQSILFQLDQRLKVLVKPGVLTWNLWNKARGLAVLLPVVKEVTV